ncbi:TetR/AcrR family transcriptional regulator [Frankia sp. AiPs1]|uniref:TetR/AcrR family transcriptional regulator n=1 Tax=Frankia sp. AiPs1 TaxID=573493 RepID=UPI002044BC80|nr:TetR/AcrR family transcriptional regulator [Frankia sp. AiPs1]MCM3921029.1 TetR/AcrR family transcriptional regulator [Frankia sp. AiPs1]
MAERAVHARQRRADGERTRTAILDAAVRLSTVDGLEGLSIGNLAKDLGMSKGGVYAHFDSKQDLQLATVEAAGAIFRSEVIEPALTADPGVPQLLAFCDAYFDHLERRVFPGGCFFAGAALEMGTHRGPVQEKVAEFHSGFIQLIREFVRTAVGLQQLPPDEDPAALALELNGTLLAADTSFVMYDDPSVLDLGRRVVRRRLGRTEARGNETPAKISNPR